MCENLRTNVFVLFPLVVVHFLPSSVVHRVGSVTFLHAHCLFDSQTLCVCLFKIKLKVVSSA